MKKNALTIFVLISGLVLTSCGNEKNKERIISKDVYALNDDGTNLEKLNTINLLYKAKSDVPYVSLKEGISYANLIRETAIGKDSYISLKYEGDTAIYTSSENETVTLNIKDQTVTYSDLASFDNHIQPAKNCYSLFSPKTGSSVHLLENKYEKGKSYTINLKDYSRIDIYQRGEDYYLPLTTFNDLFISPISMFNLIYHFDDVYLLSNDVNFTTRNEEGETVLTPVGEAFYSRNDDNPTVSKEYAEYNYQAICLNFDYFYGVRDLKGRSYASFDNYLATKGYKDDLLSGNVKKMDAAYAYALSTLKDFHTTLSASSPLYAYGDDDIDESKYDPFKTNEEKAQKELSDKRKEAGAELGFSVDLDNGIAYIAFDDFDSVDENALNKTSWTEEDLNNSATLFYYAYNQIINKYIGNIDYVAIDLATNNGGSADGMAYMLGILLGEFSVEIQEPFGGSHAKSTYAVDINRDGKVDEKDVSLREYGKQIVFIDTHFAFSCGNAFPVFAKDNYPDEVSVIGETTGGGTCVIRKAFTPIGSNYVVSGLLMLSKRKDGKLTNIEDGVTPDIALEVDKTIDRGAVADIITNL